MEQRIKFITENTYAIPEEDKRRFYTLMALLKYDFFRYPEYNELKALRLLKKDYYKFLKELMAVCREQPNNLALNGLRKEIIFHYSYVKQLCKRLEREKAEAAGETPPQKQI